MGSIVSVKERARKKTMVITSFGSQVLSKHQARVIDTGNQRGIEWQPDVTKRYRNIDNNIDGKGERIDNNKSKRRYKGKNLERKSVDQVNEQIKSYPHGQNSHGVSFEENNRREEFHPVNKNLKPDSPRKVVKESESPKSNVCLEDALDVELNGMQRELKCKKEKEPGGVSIIEREPCKKTVFDGDQGIEKFANSFGSSQEAVPPVEKGPLQIIGTKSSSMLFAQAEPVSVPNNSRACTPVHNTVGNWGKGVIGTSEHVLDHTGNVTSRGVDAEVKSSADYYNQFAYVSSYRSPTPNLTGRGAKKSHTGECTCQACTKTRVRERAAVRIQSHMRGYQARREMLKRRKSIVKIQRIYRAKIQKKLSEGKAELMKPWENDSRRASENGEVEMRKVAKENFELYQEDITELKWQSQRLIEIANMGDDYDPQKILLISSNIPRPEWLARITLKDVHVIMYQFSHVTIMDLLKNVALSLEDYQVGSKAKRIAFVCQGGPGYAYICKGRVLTSKKLEKEPDLRDFFKDLGGYISKKDPDDTKMHFIGCNVTGNKNGELLLQNVQKAMQPARVLVESPLEISQKGYEMLTDYFDIDLYRIWKKNRYTKIRINGLEE